MVVGLAENVADADNEGCGGIVIVLATIAGMEHEFCNVDTDILLNLKYFWEFMHAYVNCKR